jgi:hypothetical protein
MDVVDVGEYCRIVEDHLTRVNGGHLVRIVGPAFDLVRQWAESGIPASVVFRGIDRKAERHRLGRAKRPLRLEFCEADVREVYRHWRRAVGLFGIDEAGNGQSDREGGADAGAADIHAGEQEARRRPSLTRHLDRAIERFSRAMARVDIPDDLRAALEPLLQELVDARAAATGARGDARDEIVRRLHPIDERLSGALRSFAPAEARETTRLEAETELAAYRNRLAGDAWPRAVSANADRLLRDRYGLPTLTGTGVFSTDLNNNDPRGRFPI